jgi:hypothetical protein
MSHLVCNVISAYTSTFTCQGIYSFIGHSMLYRRLGLRTIVDLIQDNCIFHSVEMVTHPLNWHI